MENNESDNIISGYPQEAEPPDIKGYGRIVSGDGLKFIAVNVLFFVFVNNFAMDLAACAGIICGILLLTKTIRCREILIVNYILSAAPILIYLVFSIGKLIINIKSNCETSLGGWVFLFSLIWVILQIIALAAVSVGYFFVQLVGYVDFFETKEVNSYIQSKRKP